MAQNMCMLAYYSIRKNIKGPKQNSSKIDYGVEPKF